MLYGYNLCGAYQKKRRRHLLPENLIKPAGDAFDTNYTDVSIYVDAHPGFDFANG